MFFFTNAFNKLDVIAGKKTMLPSGVAARPPILGKSAYGKTYM